MNIYSLISYSVLRDVVHNSATKSNMKRGIWCGQGCKTEGLKHRAGRFSRVFLPRSPNKNKPSSSPPPLLTTHAVQTVRILRLSRASSDLQTLKNRRVLRVGRNHVDTILLQQGKHGWSARDECFLVRQRDSFPLLDSLHSGHEPSAPNDTWITKMHKRVHDKGSVEHERRRTWP